MTDKFIIKGGKPLGGDIEVHGSKNAAPKLMIASLLTDEPCIIENIPLSGEMEITKELCEQIGSLVVFGDDHNCRISTEKVKTSLVSRLSRRNRIPILAIGPLLHRNGVAEVPVLQGCPIGHRPVNFHLEALNKMGVRIERREHSYFAEASKIKGADISLSYPSVGATENIILTAVLAEGNTVIRNAAIEPEIMNLVEMLITMGAGINCDLLSRKIEIFPVSRMRGARARVIPDRTEIISFAAAALATGGEILIRNIKDKDLAAFLEVLRRIGGLAQIKEEGILFSGKPPYHASTIETSPHPGFMTDWQQPFCVLLTQAQGESIIHETVYEDRFGYVKDLQRMGSAIHVSDECFGETCRFAKQTFNHSARIIGPTPLHGKELEMTDIRAGMAHIIAALAAEGESIISGVEHVDRGYERIDERLRVLGSDIIRIVS